MLQKIKEYLNPGPGNEWFQEAAQHWPYTPDYTVLEQYEQQLLFVYDDMMLHRSKQPQSSAWFRFGSAFTRTEYTCFTKKAGTETFPIPLPPAKFRNKARIKGELWLVRPKEFLWLDKQKENTVSFIRKRVHITIPYRKTVWTKGHYNDHGVWVAGMEVSAEKITKKVVWMYIGIPDHWEPLLDGGFRFGEVSRYVPNNPNKSEYYYFSTRDYEIGGTK